MAARAEYARKAWPDVVFFLFVVVGVVGVVGVGESGWWWLWLW